MTKGSCKYAFKFKCPKCGTQRVISQEPKRKVVQCSYCGKTSQKKGKS